VPPWAEVVRRRLSQRQHCLHRLSHSPPLLSRLLRPHHRRRGQPHLRRGRHPHRDLSCCQPQSSCRRLHQPDQLIHTIALWDSISPGMDPNSSGVAGFTTSVASQPNRQRRQIPTIARMVSRIGRLDGVSPRRTGAAGFMARAAPTKVAVDVWHLLSHMTATLASPIGCRGGAWRRRPGVVRTRARVARQQLEAVPERQPDRWGFMPWRWLHRGHLPVPNV